MSCVSVIIPARDAALTIKRTLASLVPDSALIGEVLLIDDSSEDDTGACAHQAAEHLELPLRAIRFAGVGAGGARNAGIAQARCPLIFFLDADDALVPGGLGLLVAALERETGAGLAIGASVRKTTGLSDLVRTPSGYGRDLVANAERYLLNTAPPISVGSGLVRAEALVDIRFPESIALDEDTWFWSALLASTGVAAIGETVVHYDLDPYRTAQRYLNRPRRTWLAISREFRRLREYGISEDVLGWRRAWLAQRFARQLIKCRQFGDAAELLRPVRAHRAFRHELRTIRYRILTGLGQAVDHRSRAAFAPHRRIGDHRTLIVCHDPAWPPVSGADLRNSQIAAAAARCGPTLLVSLRPHDATAPEPEFAVASLAHPDDPRTPSVNKIRNRIERRIPRLVLERLLETVQRFRPDTIIVEGIHLHALLRVLRPFASHLILDMHNLESDLSRQTGQGGWRKAGRKISTALIAWHEARALRIADRVWTCTREDLRRLLAAHRLAVPADIVSNGIPRHWQAPGPGLDRTPDPISAPHILYIGHLGYQPNIDAAVRLVNEIFPLIRVTFPNAVCILAGRYPRPVVQKLAALPGIELHENPADLAPLYDRAHVTVIPLAAGGGSRIKILEAAAMGLPVVATSVAAEGLNLENDRHILVAETDSNLAALTVRLLRDPEVYARLRRDACAAVWRRYGPDQIARAVRAGLRLDEAATPMCNPSPAASGTEPLR